jgi:hydrogenase expression/formation protein HypD
VKYVDEFRDAPLIRRTVDEIHRLSAACGVVRIMEICGGHTHAIFRFGLHQLLPDNIELIHGPGCPVCVLPMSRMDLGLAMARPPDVIFAAFGDVMRVPGASGSPIDHQARGLDVRMVYSPMDVLRLARENPDRRVLFFAIGFETTAPTTAVMLMQARRERLDNLFVLSNHILVCPAIRALLDMPDMRLDAFIGPGHVSTIIGCRPYEFIARDYCRPVVVSGFEPLDLLQSIAMILRQRHDGQPRVENQYARAVSWDGNVAAQRAMDAVFEVRDAFEWRGLGAIPASGLRLAADYVDFDAEHCLVADRVATGDPATAPCGDVLKGAMKPRACRLFGKTCTPETPVGALMVSSEGACAAEYRYALRVDRAPARTAPAVAGGKGPA